MRLLQYIPFLFWGFIQAQEEVVHSVYFESNKFEVNEKEVCEAIDFISKTDSTRIENVQIFGYSDDVGKEDYNFKLSTNRAVAIQNRIIENGIKSKIIVTIEGKGRILIEDDMKEFLRSYFLILNVAVGGYWPGEPDETTVFPQTMYTDYIRVYAKNGFQAPDAPVLNIEEETVGQLIEQSIADHAIQDGFTDLGTLEAVVYGPGAPEVVSSDTAIDGDASLVFNFPGENWGGGYLQLETSKDISAFTALKFSLNKPDSLVNCEIKLESVASDAVVYLADYTGTELSDGFVEYTIPLADFSGLDNTELTIPFSIWNPEGSNGAYVKATVLIDNIYFSM